MAPLSDQGPRTFISYAREDSEFALKLARDLRQAGANIWVDQLDIVGGARWDHAVQQALDDCPRMVVILSPASIPRNNVLDEARYALDEGKEVIPVLYRECKVPFWLGVQQQPKQADQTAPDTKTAEHTAAENKARHDALRKRAQQIRKELNLPPINASTDTDNRATKPPNKTNISRGQKAAAITVNPKDGLDYVWIPRGPFLMGATPDDTESKTDEKPQHVVRISIGFWLTKSPVPVAAYKRFTTKTGRRMPPAPSFNINWDKEDHPIVNVTWDDAQAYCKWAGGRLPTEAECEYAARGGTENRIYPWGNDIGPEHANYGEMHKGTTRISTYPPNAWGLHDMVGNVQQWVADWYDSKYYSTFSGKPAQDPLGPNTGKVRVARGGSWYNDPKTVLRVASRAALRPAGRDGGMGFRCALDV
jgi:sulfatase modifying factor 1